MAEMIAALSEDLPRSLAELSCEERLTVAALALAIDPHASFDWARHPNSKQWRVIDHAATEALVKIAEAGMDSVADGAALASRIVKLCLATLKANQV